MAANRRGVLGAASLLATATPALSAEPPRIPTGVGRIEVINLRELESGAQAVLPKPEFDYIAGGAGDEWTMGENLAAFKRLTLVPRFLGDHRPVDPSVTLLGDRLASPVFVSPMGGHGMAHVSAEAGTAEGAAAEGALATISCMSTLPLEAVASSAAGPKWFHIYLPADPGVARELLQRAKAAGYRAIVFSVDTAGSSNRERNIRNHYEVGRSAGNGVLPEQLKRTVDWPDVSFIQKESGLPVVLKGVLSPEVARRAVAEGVEGVQVSNHGGRAMDDSPATIVMLPRVAEAVNGKAMVLLDSGVRRGQDVVKALALGADAVGIGRPILYGLALGGAPGVQAVLARIKEEVAKTMEACAVRNIAAIDRTILA